MPVSDKLLRNVGVGSLHRFRLSERCVMELEGVVHNGVIVPDDATALAEGTRVRITPAPVEHPRPFGERFARTRCLMWSDMSRPYTKLASTSLPAAGTKAGP